MIVFTSFLSKGCFMLYLYNNFNLMNRHLSSSLNFIKYHLIQPILLSALATASTNAFLNKNLSTFIVEKQQQTFSNLTHQSEFKPLRDGVTADRQALPLEEDSLMPVTQMESRINVIEVTTKTLEKVRRKNSIGQLKKRMTTDRQEIQETHPYKSETRELPQENGRQSVHRDSEEYIARLRHHKEAERQREVHPQGEIRRQKPRPPNGQKIVFDYQGNFSKGKEPAGRQFDQQVLSSSIETAQNAKRTSPSQRGQSTMINAKLQRSVRNKTDFKSEFQLSPKEKRELMLKELKISNSRTKLVFDGHTVTRQEEETVNSKSEVPLVEAKRKKSSVRPLLPSSNEQDANIQTIQGEKAKEKDRSGQRGRVKTVISEGKKQWISIQNQSLKKVLLTEVEDSHFQLPKHRIKCIVTNPSSVVGDLDPDLAKIRQKLNIRVGDEKLPRILSKYSNLERDIIKEIRKKNKV